MIKAIGPVKKDAVAYLVGIRNAIREGRFFDMKKENRTTFDELLDVCIEKMKAQKYFETLAHASEEMTKRYPS